MSKFRYCPIGPRLEKYVEECNPVPRPAEVPLAACRNGEYYVRTGRGRYAEFFHYEGAWYHSGEDKRNTKDAGASSFLWWCASKKAPDRCLTKRELESIQYLLRTHLLSGDSPLAVRYSAWGFYQALRATTQEAKLGNLRCRRRGSNDSQESSQGNKPNWSGDRKEPANGSL